MKTRVILSGIIAFAMVFAAAGVVAAGGDSESEMADTGDKAASEPMNYVEYSSEAFEAAADMQRVYFFHASWCPSCRNADRDIRKNLDLIPEGVVVFKTDYDDEKDLKTQYGITYQHTFVLVDADGNAIKKWSGGSAQQIADEVGEQLAG